MQQNVSYLNSTMFSEVEHVEREEDRQGLVILFLQRVRDTKEREFNPCIPSDSFEVIKLFSVTIVHHCLNQSDWN
jgi:hypothetical protein